LLLLHTKELVGFGCLFEYVHFWFAFGLWVLLELERSRGSRRNSRDWLDRNRDRDKCRVQNSKDRRVGMLGLWKRLRGNDLDGESADCSTLQGVLVFGLAIAELADRGEGATAGARTTVEV
jgi:hypothetical protein